MQRAAAHYPQRKSLFPDRRGRGTGLLGADFARIYRGRIDPWTLTKDDFRPDPGFGAQQIWSTLKRLCDLAIGGFLLVLLLPLLVSVALALKLDSRGPVFDRQRRVGGLDRPFTLFRFRVMTADTEWAGPTERQITRVGRCLRRSRIDRLPQLANVIRGDMSLIGPRPERAHVVGQLARTIPLYHQRHDVRPGLTGWAQVKLGHGDRPEDARERLAYDLYYVKHHGIILDLFVLMSTVQVALASAGRAALVMGRAALSLGRATLSLGRATLPGGRATLFAGRVLLSRADRVSRSQAGVG